MCLGGANEMDKNMGRILVAHQPYFFPWLGYFNKLAYATHFWVLDDAQYRTRFFHNRAIIRNSHGSKSWMTLPVEPTHRCAIADVRVSSSFDIAVMDNLVWDAYHKSIYYEELWPAMREIILASFPILVDINISLIKYIMSLIDFPVPDIFFSKIGAPFTNPTQRLIYGCNICEANWIIMGEGGSLDCHNLNAFKERNVKIIIQKYIDNHPEYSQFGEGVIPVISILDALMCVGPEKTHEMVALSSVFTPSVKI